MILNDILNIINIICQIIVAISAIIAIIITIKQIKGKSRINVKVKFAVCEAIRYSPNFHKSGSREEIEHLPILSIGIYNNGISKIFINSTGIACVQRKWKKKKNGEFVAQEGNFILEPGIYKNISLSHFELWLAGNDQVNETDIIYITIEYNMDKSKQYKTTYNLGTIKEDWENRLESIKKSDNKFFMQQISNKILQ